MSEKIDKKKKVENKRLKLDQEKFDYLKAQEDKQLKVEEKKVHYLLKIKGNSQDIINHIYFV